MMFSHFAPTPEALDIIIPTLLSKGYEFVTLSELFERKGVTLSPTDNKMYVTVTEVLLRQVVILSTTEISKQGQTGGMPEEVNRTFHRC
jgi:hypothetical protein